jgi:hypothetical protein
LGAKRTSRPWKTEYYRLNPFSHPAARKFHHPSWQLRISPWYRRSSLALTIQRSGRTACRFGPSVQIHLLRRTWPLAGWPTQSYVSLSLSVVRPLRTAFTVNIFGFALGQATSAAAGPMLLRQMRACWVRFGRQLGMLTKPTQCPLVAQSGHHNCADECPHSGVKRT